MALLCWSNAPAYGAPNLSVILTPGAPLTNELLTATPGMSGNGLVYNYDFKVNGASVQSGPARTLDLSQTGNGDVGQTVSVQVAASGGATTVAPATASITVANSEPTPNSITYSTSVNIPFSQQLEGKDDDNEALTYSLAVGTLPTGLTLSTSGLISGTPTTVGRSDFSVSVTDGKATKTAKFIIIVSSNSDGVGPTIVTRDPLAQTYTRDQLASLIYRGTIKDTAQGNIAPSGVSQLLFQLRRPSDNTAYSGPSDGFTTNLNRGYYSALLQAPVPNDTSGTRDFRRTFSTFIPPASMLTPDDYSLVIASQDVAGNWSIEVVPLTIVAAPAAPTALTATAGDGQVTLLWNAVSDARSYRVYCSTTSGNHDFTNPVAIVKGTSAIHTGLTNGTTYFYVVRSINRIGESPDSNEASATPVVAVRQLDLQIEALTASASPLIGEDVYYPDDQTATFSIPDRTLASFRLRVKNNGNVADTYRLSGRGDTPGWTVRYFDALSGGTDISTQVKGNNYIGNLFAGSSRDFRVEVTPDASVAQNTSKDVPVSVVSEQDSAGALDRVLARSIQASAPPPPPAPTFRADGAVRVARETAYVGIDIYSSSAGTSQSVSGTASGAVAAVYGWKIRNTGTNADSFRLTLPALDANWSVRLYDALDGGTDITPAAQSASGFATATLSPQQAVELRLEVQPQNGVSGSNATTLTATSVGEGSGNTRDVCLASTLVGSVAANPVVSFSGATRACAGGIDNVLHQLNLTLHASDGGANLVNTPLVLRFENNVGHDYGTAAAPDVRHKAKIYDPNEPIVANRWKESVTLTTDANGDIPVTVLSSDVISQPRLIASFTNAGQAAIVGGIACEFTAATSRRGFPDPVVGTYSGWEAHDTGWTCDFSPIEKSGDTTLAKLYIKYQDITGIWHPVVGHQIKIGVSTIGLPGDSQINDPDEATRFIVFVDGSSQSASAIVTTDSSGLAQVTIKGKNLVKGVRNLQFAAQSLSQWAQ